MCSTPSLTNSLASFIAEADLSNIPQGAVEVAKRAYLDTIAVAIAGSGDDCGRIIVETVRNLGGRPEAGVLGAGFQTNAADAALANGTLAHALDYDDVNPSMRGHPSVSLVPATLALGEKLGADGRGVIEAYVIGLEVAARVGRMVNPDHYHQGWHCTSTLGSLGAAAAAARLYKLNAAQAARALGIAASLAAGLKQNFGTMTKPLHAGNAARNGVLAGLLTSAGFTADQEILEGHSGFLEVFSGIDSEGAANTLDGLGDSWEVLSPGLSVKLYPCCAATHRSIDAMLELIHEHDLRPEQVKKVEAGEYYLAEGLLINPRPITPLEAKFSMQYTLAACLMDRRVTLAQFVPEKLLEPRTRQLMERISLYVHPEMRTRESIENNHFAVVTVTLKDGRRLECRVDAPSGDPSRSPTREDLIAKYYGCVEGVLPREEAERLLAGIERMETLDDVGELAGLAAGLTCT